MALKIYGTPRSLTIRTLWIAHELALEYELIETPLGADGTQAARYKRINPNGRVPCIDDDGLVLWESMAIGLYLAKKTGGPLGPVDIKEDGRMTMWGFWTVTEVEAAASTVIYHGHLLPPEARDHVVFDTALATLQTPLDVLEGALEMGGGCLVGGRFTIADLNAIATVFYLRFAPGVWENRPALRSWYENGMARPARIAAFALRGDEHPDSILTNTAR